LAIPVAQMTAQIIGLALTYARRYALVAMVAQPEHYQGTRLGDRARACCGAWGNLP